MQTFGPKHDGSQLQWSQLKLELLQEVRTKNSNRTTSHLVAMDSFDLLKARKKQIKTIWLNRFLRFFKK